MIFFHLERVEVQKLKASGCKIYNVIVLKHANCKGLKLKCKLLYSFRLISKIASIPSRSAETHDFPQLYG